jgi:hypothetical protein
MKLLKYIDFIVEARGDVKCPAVISESFIKRCKKIDSPISQTLIDMDRRPSSYTFIDDGLNSETIQYTESERAIDVLNKMYGSSGSNKTRIKSMRNFDPQKYLSLMTNPGPDSQFWLSNRVDIRIGRFVRRFLGDVFTDAQIEDFVNKWKSSFKSEGEKFEFRTGNGIVDAYDTTNYYGEEGYNPLWHSCMNDRTDLVEFYLYVKDLEMVVLVDSENKIMGRALLWTDVEGRKLLDRVYYINDKDYYKFINLAKENGWYYKKRNISGGSTWILDGQEQKIKVKIKFPVKAFSKFRDQWQEPKFPYVDSFYYLSEEGFLMNFEPSGSYYVLNDTDGQYEYYSGVYDVYGNRVENEDDYIYSETQKGLVSLYNSEHVQYDGFDDYIHISYLEDPKNGFLFDDEEQMWYKREDFEKMKSSK